MELFDTHAHLDADAFAEDLEEVIAHAESAGVSRIMTIGITLETSRAAVELAETHKNVFAVVGIQPNYAAEAKSTDLAEIESLLTHPKVVAIGETGLDRYWDFAPLDVQITYFRDHLRLAFQYDLPFIIHCRDAEEDVIQVLDEFKDHQPFRGVMHSFCGSKNAAERCLAMGMHLSFSGMVTYKKNSELRSIAESVPADRLLIETDAPYLVPTPKRGKIKRNEPAFVEYTARTLADVKGMSPEELAKQTTQNAVSLFRIATR
ncbi:MAG: TatD family hydrolase [Planctomycetaceae bacterium]|nr:TatD family hydrolase [Planctomycetaceae bacterium]